MTLAVVAGPQCLFDEDIHDLNDDELHGKALAGNLNALARLLKSPTLVVQATTASSDDGGEVANLSDLGVTFPANTIREVKLRYKAETDDDWWYFERTYHVLGGSTPVLLDSAPEIEKAVGRIGSTSVKYGRVKAVATYAGDTATAVSASSSPGSSLGNNSTNTITFTHPVARDTPKALLSVNASSDVATNTEQLHVAGIPATSTTMSLFAGALVDGAADGFDDAGYIAVSAYIEPPPNAFLSVSSSEVICSVLGVGSDSTKHTVELEIGKLQKFPNFLEGSED